MIRNGYYIASNACGRDKNGKFVCVCGKCRVMTNANRIRAMSDEELAHLLYSAEEHLLTGNLWNYKKWTEWLKNEAEEGET